VFKYSNRNELRGAAMAAPENTRQILANVMRFCADNHASLRGETARALKSWESRHAYYLAASAGIREEFDKLATDPSSPPEVRAQYKMAQEQLAEMVAQTVSAMTEALLAPLRIRQKSGNSEAMCKEYVQSVDDGKWDLKRNDPDLAKFFDEQRQAK
jgi:hypothetical protein